MLSSKALMSLACQPCIFRETGLVRIAFETSGPVGPLAGGPRRCSRMRIPSLRLLKRRCQLELWKVGAPAPRRREVRTTVTGVTPATTRTCGRLIASNVSNRPFPGQRAAFPLHPNCDGAQSCLGVEGFGSGSARRKMHVHVSLHVVPSFRSLPIGVGIERPGVLRREELPYKCPV